MRLFVRPFAFAALLALATGAACTPHPEDAGRDESPGTGRPAPPGETTPGTGANPGVHAATGQGTGGGTGTPHSGERDAGLVVARMGTEEVTLGDIDRMVRRRALLRGVPPDQVAPPERWRDPYFLVTMADAVLQERRLLVEGERLGLMPDLEELLAAWRAHPQLSALLGPRFDDLESQLHELLDLGVDDVYHLLRLELVHDRWVDRVLADVDDARIWDEYRYRRRTVTALGIAIPNVPTRDELADYLDDPAHQAELERLYAEHPRRFTVPESVDARIVRVRVAEDAPEEAWEAARARAEALRDEVLAGGDMAAMSVERSDDGAADRGGLLEGVVERQLPEVFGQELGGVGPLRRDAWGWYFARVEARHPQRQRPFDELLRRELAAQTLADTRLLATARRKADRVLEAMRAGDDDALAHVVAEEGLRREVIGPVRYEPEGHIAGVGLAPALRDALFALREPGDVAPEPFLVEGTVWVVRLLERHEPTPAELAAERDSFVAELRDLIRATAWDAFWGQELEATPLELVAPADYLEGK